MSKFPLLHRNVHDVQTAASSFTFLLIDTLGSSVFPSTGEYGDRMTIPYNDLNCTPTPQHLRLGRAPFSPADSLEPTAWVGFLY